MVEGSSEHEEAGGHQVSLSRMRSDLSPSLSFPHVWARSSRGPDVGIAKHCPVMSVITPTSVSGRPGGPYRRPSWLEIAGPRASDAAADQLAPLLWDTVLEDRVPSRRDSNG